MLSIFTLDKVSITSHDNVAKQRGPKVIEGKGVAGQIKSAEFHVRLGTRARAAYEEYAQGSVKMCNTGKHEYARRTSPR